jgi:MoaA/NifB/PqqE/SkfB family radical SAM enzyme
MFTIDDLTVTFMKTYQKSVSDSAVLPIILRDPAYLGSVIKTGEERRLRNSKKQRIPVPRFCIFSVTWKCNLSCTGCYAKCYSSKGTLTLSDIDKIARHASDLGSFIFIIAGGEPLTIPNLIGTLSKIDTALFFVFTNGTLLTEEILNQMEEARNIIPTLSIEGDSKSTDSRRGAGVSGKIDAAMKKLDSRKIGFGFSAMATHKNLREIVSREWLDAVWKSGARFGFIIDYIPFKNDLDPSLVLTKEDMVYKKTALLERNKEGKPLLTNFPPDEYGGDSCQAAGKGFIHINADGFVEPCPFCHYAADNLKKKSLEAVLGSPFFSAIRSEISEIPFNGTCLLFEHDRKVNEIANKTNAHKTDA